MGAFENMRTMFQERIDRTKILLKEAQNGVIKKNNEESPVLMNQNDFLATANSEIEPLDIESKNEKDIERRDNLYGYYRDIREIIG